MASTKPVLSSQKRGKRKQPTNMSNTTYNAGPLGGAVRRIRSPGEHDVLSGRGGGINSHVGNIQFRKWVATRKNDYNLAASKADKARVAQEVIALVKSQTPPGRFLQKDPTASGGAGWWVELDDDRTIAKTSQALREGAPQIRAAHKDDLHHDRKTKSGRRTKKTTVACPITNTEINTLQQAYSTEAIRNVSLQEAVSSEPVLSSPQQMALEELRSNAEAAKHAQELQEDASEAVSSEPVLSSPQQMALVELRSNVEAAKHAQELQEDASMQPPQKRVRVSYRGYALHPAEASPPVSALNVDGTDQIEALSLPAAAAVSAVPAPAPLELPAVEGETVPGNAADLPCGVADVKPPVDDTPPLLPVSDPVHSSIEEMTLPSQDFPRSVPLPRRLSAEGGLKRAHSLGLSDIGDSELGDLEFVNPFENESELEWRGDFVSSPRPGFLRETRDSFTSNGDMGGIGALLRSDSLAVRSPSTSSGVRARHGLANMSSRPLTSVLSDLPDLNVRQQENTDFMEGMKVIYDALHPDMEEESIPTHLYPYCGSGVMKVRRASGALTASRAFDGRQ